MRWQSFRQWRRVLRVLQIRVRLAPLISVNDIRKRDTADWPEPTHWVADRQQGIRVDSGRQSECGLRFLLELQIQGRQSRTEAERSRCEQYVLNRRIDGRPGRADRGSAFEAWNDPNRGLMDVRGQIFRRVEQPQKSFPAHARGRFTRPIPRCNLFIPGALVVGPDSLLDLRIADYQETPSLRVAAARGPDARLQDLSGKFVRHRVWFQPPHRPSGPDDLEYVGSVR